MIRVLIISDFTESFSHKLLAGIVDYSRRKEQWIVRRMPPEYKTEFESERELEVVGVAVGVFRAAFDIGT